MIPQVAVIGCGYWGKNLVRNFGQLGALRIIGKGNKERRTWQIADGRWRMGTISYKPSAISQFGPRELGDHGHIHPTCQ